MSDRWKVGLPRNLKWAIEYGNKNDILKILDGEKKVDWGITTNSGDTLAHLIFQNYNCAERDVIELLESLFDRGIDPNIENGRQETVLHLAVANRMRDVVDFLLKRKVGINKIDKNGHWIAHFFIEDENKTFSQLFDEKNGRLKISDSKLEEMENESANFVEWLIDKGFDFDRRNKFGQSALDLSIEYNLHHILIVLLKHTNDVHHVTEYNETLLHKFFYKSPDYRKRYGYNSRYAANIVKILLEKGVSAVALDNDNKSPLVISLINGQELSIMEMMINHLLKTYGLNYSATDVLVQLFEGCAWWGCSKLDFYLATLRTLVAKGANVNGRPMHSSPLIWACGAKNVHAVEFLNDHGADFSVITQHRGNNMFHMLACRPNWPDFDQPTNEEKEALFELLASKVSHCDMHVRNNDNVTPLYVACGVYARENPLIARKLIEYGADVNSKNIDGQTPLHYAAANGAVAAAELLLQRGADVNSKDAKGRRPIFYALESDKRLDGSAVPVLLTWGVAVNATIATATKWTPLSRAIVRRYSSITKQMLAYGAEINPSAVYHALYSYLPEGDNTYSLRRLIEEHSIKLCAANLPCFQGYERRCRISVYSYTYGKFRDDCCAEVERLKSTFIDSDQRTSLYTFLHMNLGSRRTYFSRKELKDLVDSPDLESQFPQYSVLILASYRETATWKALLQPAKQALGELCGITTISKQSKVLPDLCSELILGYLKSEDLLSVIDCVEDELSQ